MCLFTTFQNPALKIIDTTSDGNNTGGQYWKIATNQYMIYITAKQKLVN